MYKAVDEDHPQIDGFCYTNKNGHIEVVDTSIPSYAHLKYNSGGVLSAVYYEDIPNMIKALTAAHQQWKDEND